MHLKRVAGQVTYRGSKRPGKSLYLCVSLWRCWSCCVQEAGRPGKSLYLCGVVDHICYVQRHGDLASPCICGVVGHAMYRGRERPSQSLLFCGVAGHAVYRRLAGKSLLFYGGRGHVSTHAGRPGKSSLFCDVVGNIIVKKQGGLACPCCVVV